MRSITPLERRLDDLAGWVRSPDPERAESARWLAALSWEEISRGGEILTRMGNDQEPTAEDMAFLLELARRPPVDLPPVDPSQPVCFVCGQQPATERGHPPSNPVCEDCWRHMLGAAYDWP